ncbi:MAG: transcriptional regulator [Syntrophomonadaceae bacterium]|nr:transcriptional regulator [Syntrophomonadaceae bacterium]
MAPDSLDRIVDILSRSRNTVVVTGAGISTEAGIPDFRGADGIYRQLGEQRVMNIINIDAFRRNPEGFWSFYRQHFMFPPVEPSLAHRVLAELERKRRISAVVTQNIDNLHQRAGSKRVFAIHGNADRFVCLANPAHSVDASYINSCPQTAPPCPQCGAVLKPDVVLFGEPIRHYLDAYDAIVGARVLVVIGSSLTVYPLAGFVKEFSTLTQELIIINKGRTELDHAAAVKLEPSSTGQALQEIARRLEERPLP